MRNRARLGLVGLLLCFVIAAFGLGAGAASGAETTTGKKCSPGKSICLTVKTFNGITASEPAPAVDGTRYTYVEWTVQNDGGSTLTQVKVTATTSVSTATFATPLPAGCTGGGTSITCSYANLPARTPPSSASTRAFFKTADAPAESNDITVTASTKEGGNDANTCPSGGTDPNCDNVSWTVTNSYEPEPNEALTFGLNGNRFRLPTNDGLSSFTFTAPGSAPFLTSFKKLATTESATLCFDKEVCFDRPLEVGSSGVLSFGQSTPVLFYSRLADAPVAANKLNAIHFYDAVPLTLLAGNRLTAAPSFASMDGLRLTADAFGQLAGKYFVVGYQSSNNSFQLSLTNGGPPLTLTAGTGSGEPIRIIGDQSGERSTTLCSTTVPASTVAMPKICAVKVSGKTLDAFLWDSGNGRVNW